MSFDYNDPSFHLESRGQITPDLFIGMIPANRTEWDDASHFLGWPARLQRVHETMTEASTRLVAGLEVVLNEPEGSAQELMGLTGMNKLGLELVDRIHHHHAYEDNSVLPRFLNLFPQLATAIDLLEHDHEYLHHILEKTQATFAALRPEASSKTDIEQALKDAAELKKVLFRHTYDEEDILIPEPPRLCRRLVSSDHAALADPCCS